MIQYKLFKGMGMLACQRANASSLSIKSPPRPGEIITTICGATSPQGMILALELKLCPFIKEIRLYDTKPTLGISVDLKHINTICRVRAYNGPTQLRHAVKDAHIVVFTGGKIPSPDKPPEAVFEDNAETVKAMALQCAKYCPEAVLVTDMPPVNSLVPLISEVFKEHNCLDPNKILGMITTESIAIKCLVAEKQGLSPASIYVPIIGGSSPTTMVPLLSNAKPNDSFYPNEAEELTEALRCLNQRIGLAKKGRPLAQLPGYAAALFIADLARGLTALPHNPLCAFVRSDALQPLRYIATPLQFGRCGVAKNYGIPRLNALEIRLLEKATPVLESDIKRGEEYISKCAFSDVMDLCTC